MIPYFQRNVLLSDYTTIGLGGKADFFISCDSAESIRDVLIYANEKNIPLHVISGGSNIVFPDEGYRGIVLKVDIKGIEMKDEDDFVKINTGAGETWDDFVIYCIENQLCGAECMSGIPGSAGAAPVQNVGAYGQEVKDIIESVTAIDRKSLNEVNFINEECNFEYRNSRFKNPLTDKDRYIITSVKFRFNKNAKPVIKYAELMNYINSETDFEKTDSLKEKLIIIRNSVLTLRRKKSMVIDRNDSNTKSCGSFFTNPVLNENELNDFMVKTGKLGLNLPVFNSENNFKISAAWLIENSGFKKGYIENGAAVSSNHSLALVNKGCTTAELLMLAEKIMFGVKQKFGIDLKTEPEIIA